MIRGYTFDYMVSEQQVREIKRKHSAQLLQQPGVCGVGVEKGEDGNFVLAVHLDASQPKAAAAIPDFIEGCQVKRLFSGPFAKQ
jgi:hypothetical protein